MDDRSERLRKRRKRSGKTTRDEAVDGATSNGEPSELSETSKPSKPSDSDEPSEPDTDEDGDGGAIPVKEQQTGTYMYLPEDQVQRLRRRYNVLKAEYEFEYDEEFEKNRHFYPLVVELGLDGLDGLNVSEVRAQLKTLYD